MLVRSLLEALPLDALVTVLTHAVPALPSAPDVQGLMRPGFGAVSDQRLMKALIPPSLHDDITAAGLSGLYAISFALRHRITYASTLAHFADQPDRAELKELARELGSDAEGDLAALSELWSEAPAPPRFAFSAVGFYVVPSAPGACRAFDAYDLPGCHRATTAIFCPEHEGEAWWREPPAHSASTQSKMFTFYSKPRNAEAYDEATLGDMVERFFGMLKPRMFSQAELGQALSRFELASVDALRVLAPSELRRRFLRLARRLHPDVGGSQAEFVALRRCYEVLRGAQ